MSKPVLMIHEVREELFEKPLDKYILTFDDGLYSQFYHFDRLAAYDTEMIFFISTDIICDGEQSLEFPRCDVAHDKVFSSGNKEDYMTLDQIKYLAQQPKTFIGGHSHSHKRLADLSMKEQVYHIRYDTKRMIEWFNTNLGYRPTKFCYPYNDSCMGLYKVILEQYGFTEFYGSERIPA